MRDSSDKIKQNTKQKGISLLEVLVALMLLAVVLMGALSVRWATTTRQIATQSQLSALSVMRQAGLGFLADSPETPAESGLLETGDAYRLQWTREPEANDQVDPVLGFAKMVFDLTVDDETGSERFGVYGGRVKIGEIPWEKNAPDEDVLNTSRARQELTLKTEQSAWGTVWIGEDESFGTGESGTVSKMFDYGEVVTVRAEPKPLYHFIRWEGEDLYEADGDRVSNSEEAEVRVLMCDDKELYAIFAP